MSHRIGIFNSHRMPPPPPPCSGLLLRRAIEPLAGRRSACRSVAAAQPFHLFSTCSGAAMEGGEKQQQVAAGGVAERILPHLLNIYGSRATARDFEIYAPNATFEDPLMRAHGVKQIKSAFYTLPKVFGESKVVEYTVQEKENPMGPGKTEILIENRQHYRVLGKAVDLTTLIRLQVDEEGKVVRHEDWWDKKPLKNRETVGFPLVGRIAEATRRGAMLLTHALMGFGKDPSSSSS